MRKTSLVLLIAMSLLLETMGAEAQSLKHCFNDNQFDGWWRARGDKTLYIRTSGARYYRLDLVQQCGPYAFAGAHLIFAIHGSDTICSPMDFDLRISGGYGDIPRPCFVKSMREVPASEIASLKHLGP